jgi:hypothetical protein
MHFTIRNGDWYGTCGYISIMSSFDDLSTAEKLAFLPDVKEAYLLQQQQAEVPDTTTTMMNATLIIFWYGRMRDIARATGKEADELMETFLDTLTSSSSSAIENPMTIGMMARNVYEEKQGKYAYQAYQAYQAYHAYRACDTIVNSSRHSRK